MLKLFRSRESVQGSRQAVPSVADREWWARESAAAESGRAPADVSDAAWLFDQADDYITRARSLPEGSTEGETCYWLAIELEYAARRIGFHRHTTAGELLRDPRCEVGELLIEVLLPTARRAPRRSPLARWLDGETAWYVSHGTDAARLAATYVGFAANEAERCEAITPADVWQQQAQELAEINEASDQAEREGEGAALPRRPVDLS